jgi:hypothetical protein
MHTGQNLGNVQCLNRFWDIGSFRDGNKTRCSNYSLFVFSLSTYVFNTLIAALLVGRSPDRSPVLSLGIFSEASDKSMCPGSTQPF